jgi:Zn-dependent protease with chaperone function
MATSTQLPAGAAATRLHRANLAVGALGLATAAFTLERLLESWRVDPRIGASHTISVLGQKLAYPAANAAAIAVLALATVGLAVTLLVARAGLREAIASRRLTRRLMLHARRDDDTGAYVLSDPSPAAFVAGLLNPRIYITTATLALLDPPATAAVLAHERHHARRRDPLRLAAGRVLAQALFFLPPLQALVERHQLMAELSADEQAALTGRAGLAQALLAMDGAPGGAVHPARVDALLDADPDPRRTAFPVGIFLAAAAGVALLAATAALTAQVASGTVTLAPPFLSRQPCVVVLALVPAAVALLALRQRARIRARWLTASSRDSSPAQRSTA